jgi:hypothetical protein
VKKLLFVCMLFAVPVSAQTSLLPTVERLRAEYPAQMSREQVGALLNRIAWEHRNEGWGLLKKTGGSRCPVAPGIEASCDILVHAPSVRHFDVLSDSEAAAKPVWRDVGPCVLGPSSGCDIKNFLAPVQPANEPATPPAPVPAADPLLPQLRDQVAALTRTVEALRLWADERFAVEHGQREALASRATTLEHRVDLVERRPEPTYACHGYINLLIVRVPFGGCRIERAE